MPRALVTGATGLVGSHIVDQLLANAWTVRALVRGTSPGLSSAGVDVVTGDVLDGDLFARAASGCDVIFHAAAVISAQGDYEAYRRSNVDGTRNAIDAAERSGARLMHLSSVAVYSGRYEIGKQKVDEDAPREPPRDHAYYARSKRESENMVLDAHARGRIWATAVRPCVIYGTRDRQFVPRIARVLRFGVAPVIGGGHTTLPIVCAANVAQGALLAAAYAGAGGRAYNLTNDFGVTLRDLYRFAGEGLGRRIRTFSIPLGVATVAFRGWMRIARALSGGSSIISAAALHMVTRDNPFTSARARQELGWEPRTRPEEGLVEAFRWWRTNST